MSEYFDQLWVRARQGKEVLRIANRNRKSSILRRAGHRAVKLSCYRLHGLLPICSYCGKIRDDRNYWRQVESYFREHSDPAFSHGVCPDCYERASDP